MSLEGTSCTGQQDLTACCLPAKEQLLKQMAIEPQTAAFVEAQELGCQAKFREIDKIAEYNQLKVLQAFQKERVTDTYFESTSGYGYTDIGRDALEKVYADIFHTEDALVRPQIISGTHALAVTVFGILRPGDEIVFAMGTPYDTMQGVVGIRKEPGSLAEWGVTYKIVPLLADGKPDLEGLKKAIGPRTRVVEVQRSKGYDYRHSLSPREIGVIIQAARSVKPDIIAMVDNCYGEFVQTLEPTDVGADIACGSLIKNAGGGLAPIGGYVVGRRDLIKQCAMRLTAPGLGKEAGATLGVTKTLFEGLFYAPTVTAAAVKTAVLCAKVFQALGFDVLPGPEEERCDIVEAVTVGSEQGILSFCRGAQFAAPVDSFVTPVPWDMPGYGCPIIMAAGSFNSGASIELSADAPIAPPYVVFFQGALNYPHGKYGVMRALQEMINDKAASLPSDRDQQEAKA